jgi:uncharacterized protein (TIGR03435 family)
MRVIPAGLIVHAVLATAFYAQLQTKGSRPGFDVASIRPTKECSGRGGMKMNPFGGSGRGLSESPGTIEWDCASVAALISEAYGRYANGRAASVMYTPPSVEGGPAWIKSDLYRITAKAENAAALAMMNGPMLQTLLEDRFKLKIRRVTRQVDVYALTVTKGGAKLKPFREGSCTPFDVTRPPVPRQPGQPPYCNMLIAGKGPNLGAIDMQPATIDELSQALTRVLGRPVINRTRIAGNFSVYLEFAVDLGTPGLIPPPDAARPPGSDDPPGGRSIFSAIQEQLGLKLESTKGPSEFLVVDHVERPSEN